MRVSVLRGLFDMLDHQYLDAALGAFQFEPGLLLLLDDDFMHAYAFGIVIECADGILRRFFP